MSSHIFEPLMPKQVPTQFSSLLAKIFAQCNNSLGCWNWKLSFQLADLTGEIDQQKQENGRLKQSLADLEQLNSTWAEKNLHLSREISEFKVSSQGQ